MAAPTKKASTAVTVELHNPQIKSAVVRFDATDDNPAMRTAYVDKAVLAKLGNPDSIKITIEAA